MNRAERITKAVTEASPLYRTAMAKAYSGTASPRPAIKAQCLQCVGYIRGDVTHCTGFYCPLLAYRPHHISGVTAIAKGRDTLPPHEAAPALNRAPQTLRKWACLENGPTRPVRTNGRLAWKVSDLQALLGGSQ